MGRKHATDDTSTLTPLMFQILVVLSQAERHGYAMMQEIEERTGGRFTIGAGALYRSIKQLVDAGFILELTEKSPAHAQRRTYQITQSGRRRAESEAQVFGDIANWAREAQLLGPHKA